MRRMSRNIIIRMWFKQRDRGFSTVQICVRYKQRFSDYGSGLDSTTISGFNNTKERSDLVFLIIVKLIESNKETGQQIYFEWNIH